MFTLEHIATLQSRTASSHIIMQVRRALEISDMPTTLPGLQEFIPFVPPLGFLFPSSIACSFTPPLRYFLHFSATPLTVISWYALVEDKIKPDMSLDQLHLSRNATEYPPGVKGIRARAFSPWSILESPAVGTVTPLAVPSGAGGYLNGSALNPPPGVVPNLDHPPYENTIFLVATNTCFTIATIVFTLRFYSRIFVLRRLVVEDYVAFVGYAFIVAFILFGYRLYHGVGFFVHQWDVRVKDLSEVLHILNIASVIYSMAIPLLKIAIILEPYFILIWTTALFYSASIIAGNLYCIPYDAIWNKTIPARCFDSKAFDVTGPTINLVSHLFIFALSQLIIWRLNMRRDMKIGISLVFAVGILTIVAGGFRLGVTIQYFISPDITYHIAPLALWSLAELTLLTLVLCIPAIPSVFQGSRVISGLRSWASNIFTRFSGGRESSLVVGMSNKRSTPANSYKKIDGTTIAQRYWCSSRWRKVHFSVQEPSYRLQSCPRNPKR
ncbi:hypothetical protein EV127DRAFT_488330 [Xylaria flabelliformis]|nr:hypothetical protein EV127DRAFT_488330 [Xylaria flabelliformis]